MKPSLKANIILRGKIQCLTGLHIGGSKDKLEIGGVDAPVLRDPMTREPYIPGSSLKGRMRALLEYALGAINDGSDNDSKAGDVSNDERIVNLFGKSAGDDENRKKAIQEILEKHPGPTPLLVRDALPDDYTRSFWKQMDTELLYTEYKPENTINRITSAANPRFLERVVPGSQFDLEIVYSVYELGRKDENYIKAANEDLGHLLMGLRLVENHALGKSGSRGYGQVRFAFMSPITVYMDDYQNGGGQYPETKKKLPDFDQLKELNEITEISYTPKS